MTDELEVQRCPGCGRFVYVHESLDMDTHRESGEWIVECGTCSERWRYADRHSIGSRSRPPTRPKD